MGYYCKAPRDCGCTLWDNGKVSQYCIEEDCLSLIETYDFRKCKCNKPNSLILYGTGTAKRYIEHRNDYQPICWIDFDGYVVECENCGSITDYYASPEKAVEAWNRCELKYDGTKAWDDSIN